MIEYLQSAGGWIATWPWQTIGEAVKSFALPLAAPLAAFYVANKFGHIQADIGRRQAETAALAMKTARNKLRLDLFEKRFAIYEAFELLCSIAEQGIRIQKHQKIEYRNAVRTARWLFDTELADYLIQTVWKKIGELESASVHRDGPAGDELARQKAEISNWFSNQRVDAKLKFAPYLLFADK